MSEPTTELRGAVEAREAEIESMREELAALRDRNSRGQSEVEDAIRLGQLDAERERLRQLLEYEKIQQTAREQQAAVLSGSDETVNLAIPVPAEPVTVRVDEATEPPAIPVPPTSPDQVEDEAQEAVQNVNEESE